MKTLLLLLLTAGALVSGCSKKESTAPPTQPAAPPAPTPQAAPATPPDSTIDLQAINQALKQFARDKKRVPLNLDELVQSGYLAKTPQPPFGKRFAIDPNKVEVRIEGYAVGF